MSDKLGSSGFGLHDEKFDRIYRAKVLDNSDPSQLGRIKAQIIPYFVGIDADVIPWAVPAMPITSGAGSGTGTFAVPNIGSMVWVFFEMGSVYQPVYFAEAQDGVNGLPSFRTANYPNRTGWQTSNGTIFYVDNSANTIEWIHPSGTYIEVDSSGNILLTPIPTQRSIISAFSRIVENSVGGSLTGSDGGLITFSGALSFTLPSYASYQGLEYVFKRMDIGGSPATVLGTVLNPIEPNPLVYRQISGQYSTLHLISGGSVTSMWHVI